MNTRSKPDVEELLRTPAPVVIIGPHKARLRHELFESFGKEALSMQIIKKLPSITCALVVVVAITFFFVMGRAPKVLAQTVEALRSVTSMLCEATVSKANLDDIHHTIRWVAPDKIRADFGLDTLDETRWIVGDAVTILDNKTGSARIIRNMPHSSAWLKESVAMYASPGQLIEFIRNQEFVEIAEASRSETNGLQTVYFSKKDSQDIELIVDMSTSLPVTMKWVERGNGETTNLVLHFSWNVANNPDLMNPSFPEGVEAQVIDGATQAFPFDVRPGDGIGPIRLAMTKEEVFAIWGKPDKVFAKVSHLYYDHGVDVVISDRQGTWQIGALSPTDAQQQLWPAKKFTGRTVEGLGMGSTAKEIADAFGEPDSTQEGPGVITLGYRTRGIEFELTKAPDDGDVPRVSTIRIRRQATDG